MLKSQSMRQGTINMSIIDGISDFDLGVTFVFCSWYVSAEFTLSHSEIDVDDTSSYKHCRTPAK